ncbi:hypothetical protein EGR_11258 [Echinococcus granulosus]|uniref:Uncharacterized protein n=1 Tax=Echinococcus granulosus TaxID=6210 RepID=W6TYT0_ECHGR|nr:hypothetical protein EGR_11258 [Echinococcus granulosus]EUB53888.1 hypothetical protein EGR_11258 [Echinococcus granulosus]
MIKVFDASSKPPTPSYGLLAIVYDNDVPLANIDKAATL